MLYQFAYPDGRLEEKSKAAINALKPITALFYPTDDHSINNYQSLKTQTKKNYDKKKTMGDNSFEQFKITKQHSNPCVI